MSRTLVATGLLTAALATSYAVYAADAQRRPARPPAQSGQPATPAQPPQRHAPGPNAPEVGKAAPRTTPEMPPPRSGPGGRRTPDPFFYGPEWDFGFWWGYPYRLPYRYHAPYPWYVFPESQLGTVRLDVPQKDASVYVDGYYAGTVNDFDGVFQHLTLRAGPHEIEMRKDGFDALCVSVYVRPWQTVTYHGEMQELSATETP